MNTVVATELLQVQLFAPQLRAKVWSYASLTRCLELRRRIWRLQASGDGSAVVRVSGAGDSAVGRNASGGTGRRSGSWSCSGVSNGGSWRLSGEGNSGSWRLPGASPCGSWRSGTGGSGVWEACCSVGAGG